MLHKMKEVLQLEEGLQRKQKQVQQKEEQAQRQQEKIIRLLIDIGIPKADIAVKLGLSPEDIDRYG